MSGEIEPLWISTTVATRLYGLSRTTLWRLAKSGEIKTARIGRAVRLHRASLEEYLERATEDGASH